MSCDWAAVLGHPSGNLCNSSHWPLSGSINLGRLGPGVQVGRPGCCWFFFFIGVSLIYNVVLVSGVQQSDSVIRTHISTLF